MRNWFGGALLLSSFLLCGCPADDDGPTDSGPTDTGGSTDASEDVGVSMDAEPSDAAEDAGFPDQGLADAGFEDAGPADAGFEDCVGLGAAASDAERYDLVLGCLEDPNLAAMRGDILTHFVSLVEANDGFPIRRGNSSIFVYIRLPEFDAEDDRQTQENFSVDRRMSPIQVALDLADLSTRAVELSEVAGGFFSVETPIIDPAGQSYRFTAKTGAGADVYFSDPLSRRFDFDQFGRYSIVLGAADSSHLQWIRNMHATKLDNERPIYLYVPAGYDQSSDTYPVLYMHDGNNLFDADIPNSSPFGSWNVPFVMNRELGGGHIRPALVVGIANNSNRFGEYTHVEDDYGQGPLGGDGDDYADFLVEDLKPEIDRRYRTRPERASTGVLGSSLGGLISYHIGLRYPDVFRFIGGMSSTFGWGAFGGGTDTMIARYAATSDLASRDQVFYLDTGGGPTPPCPEADNYCEGIEMRDTLVGLGIDTFPDDPDASPLTPAGINIYHWWEPNAPHNEGAWFGRLHRPLRLFLRP